MESGQMESLSMRSTQLLVSFLWRLRSNVCRRFWVKIKPPHLYSRSIVQIIVPQKCYQIIFRKWRDFFSVKIIPRVKQILFNFYISSLQYVAFAKKLAQSTWLNSKASKRTKITAEHDNSSYNQQKWARENWPRKKKKQSALIFFSLYTSVSSPEIVVGEKCSFTKLSEIFVFYWPDHKSLDLTTFRPACWGHSEDHYYGYLTLPLTI